MPKRNKQLAKSFQGKPCLICSSNYNTVGDHIITFGSNPKLDILENIWPLCFKHHREKEDKGLISFVDKYNLHDELYSRGFERNEFTGKWYLKA